MERVIVAALTYDDYELNIKPLATPPSSTASHPSPHLNYY